MIVDRLRAVWEQPFATDADPRSLLLEAADEIERLRLTDAEREALADAAEAYEYDRDDSQCVKIAATLRGLLERLSPPAT